MIYEVSVSYIAEDGKGNEKKFRETYAIQGADTFTTVESVMMRDKYQFKDFDVYAIRRSRIVEVANKREKEQQSVFIAQLADVFTDDDGTQKETKYNIALFADDMDAAHAFIREYMQQGYNMALRSLKQSKILDVMTLH